MFDARGPQASSGVPVPISHPRPGWVEQDAKDIWRSVEAAIGACTADADLKSVAAVGISNQRETVLGWDSATGEPVGPCVTWQCRRGEGICDSVRGQADEEEIRKTTGLPLDPLFSASKAGWLANQASCPAERLRLGTVDSWLLWQLTGGGRHLCDESNASRTQLFDIHSGLWSEDLCELFGVPVGTLPDVLPSDGEFGSTKGLACLPDGIPIRAAIGDSHAALFGHGVLAPGVVKATYGTGSSLMTLVEEPVSDCRAVANTIAWNTGGKRRYALEGNILVSASVLPWLAGLLGIEDGPDELAKLAANVPDSGDVSLVPAFVGLGAPHWCSGARGLISGLTFNSGRAQLARAAFEAIAHQVGDVFAEMNAISNESAQLLYADGGPSANQWLMQLQADLLGLPVAVGNIREASALGAAGIAGIAIGLWQDEAHFAALDRGRKEIKPTMDAQERQRLRDGWRKEVARAMHGAS